MKTIDDYNFSGKRALLRVDYNVPLDGDGNVTDNTRIAASISTIKKILGDGGSVILMSHLGRPKGEHKSEMSLVPVLQELEEFIGRCISFSTDSVGENAIRGAANLRAGHVLLLENLRFHKEETDGDATFAEALAKHGDIYVNDAFGTAHRAHASTAVIAQYFEDKCAGYLLRDEVENLQKVLANPERPFAAIIGGAKVSSKISVLENLLGKVDDILIGGGMAYTFMKAQGGQVGNSLVEDDFLETAKTVLAKASEKGTTIHLPEDSIAADDFSNAANTQTVDSGKIPEGWMGLDIGPKAQVAYENVLKNSKTILWNGPAGVFEMESFQAGTKALGSAIAEATAQGAYSLVGGGDSVAAVKKFGLGEKVSYVSTGGGAMLEFIEGKVLPGVAALK